MKPLHRGILVAVAQCLLVLSLAGKYAFDRARLPRAWARAAPYDPSLPIRGRYVSLGLEAEGPSGASLAGAPAVLSVRDGRLFAEPAAADTGVHIGSIRMNHWGVGEGWRILEPVAFFIPDNVPDPSRRQPGEELWVEVSVPRYGLPRPMRLAVKKDGVLTPLELR